MYDTLLLWKGARAYIEKARMKIAAIAAVGAIAPNWL
jgi:hypothetical protein